MQFSSSWFSLAHVGAVWFSLVQVGAPQWKLVQFGTSLFSLAQVDDPIIPEDINLEISVLQDNKAHGLYSSPVRLLKLAKRVISAPLATIFNQSICSGIFPSKLKCAKIIPIF